MSRFVLTAILVASSTLVGLDTANAASSPGPAEKEVRISAASALDQAFTELRRSHAENSSHIDREPVPELIELTQAQTAFACYTFAGPVCAMLVAVPVGSPCACYYPNDALAGIAY